jgi:hypothetical protein
MVFLLPMLLMSLLGLAGCGSDSQDSVKLLLPGRVQSGFAGNALPLAEKTVHLYKTTGGDAVLLGSTVSDDNGNFAFSVPVDQLGGVMFLTAEVSPGVDLLSIAGQTLPGSIVINELTTVAGAYAFAQFFDTTTHTIAGRGTLLPLKIAAGMSADLVNDTTGGPSGLLLNSPNADQTNTLRSTQNLANLIAASVQSPDGNLSLLFDATHDRAGDAPATTTEAMVFLARNPAGNVSDVYNLSQASSRYITTLDAQPDAWTLAVKVNDTGSAAMPFGGPANTVFDDRGYAWINNNVVQGTGVSTNNIIVLKPNGMPSDGKDGTPVSPVTGGGILGAGFGITLNRVDNTIWVGNFGWGGLNPGPVSGGGDGNGSVSQIALDGTPISPESGYDGGTDRVQGIISDRAGNIWTANVGNDKVVVFLNGNPDTTAEANISCKPFGLALAADDTVWVGSIGCGADMNNSGVAHYALEGGSLKLLSFTAVGKENKGLDVDYDGSVWVASGAANTVYHLDANGSVLQAYSGIGGINWPWSIRIDDNDNVWVANFGPMDVNGSVYTDAGITVLAGAESKSGEPVGTPLSPATGFTLPSAGEEVLLSDGTPLSETGPGQPKYTPLMRAVSVIPDRAGNIWVSNNWKPSFLTNLQGNPGGDGMVIFIGLGAPTEPNRTQ